MNASPILDLIAERDRARIAALLAKDTTALDDLLDDELVYVHSTGVADTKTSYLEGLVTGKTACMITVIRKRGGAAATA